MAFYTIALRGRRCFHIAIPMSDLHLLHALMRHESIYGISFAGGKLRHRKWLARSWQMESASMEGRAFSDVGTSLIMLSSPSELSIAAAQGMQSLFRHRI